MDSARYFALLGESVPQVRVSARALALSGICHNFKFMLTPFFLHEKIYTSGQGWFCLARFPVVQCSQLCMHTAEGAHGILAVWHLRLCMCIVQCSQSRMEAAEGTQCIILG